MSKKKNKGKTILIVILVILVIAATACLVWVNSMGKPADESNTDLVRVEIKSGSGTEAIGNMLEEAGVINNCTNFRIKSKLAGNDGQYKAGIYEFSPSMEMDEIMKELLEGRVAETLRFTIPEGSTVSQTAMIIANTGVCSMDDFMAAASAGDFEYAFLEGIPAGERQLEGYLYPDTYEIYKTEKPHEIINRMLKRFDQVYTEVKEASAGSAVLSKYTEYQIITIASMIEREAKLDAERPLVASVINNRLDKGMRLQFCSTVQYALGKHKDRLYYSDLEVDSPYNTYKVDGLPAGPIASPGRASLEAALNPAETDYLYFVVSAAGDGSHNFAATGDDFSSYKDDYLASLAG